MKQATAQEKLALGRVQKRNIGEQMKNQRGFALMSFQLYILLIYSLLAPATII